MEKRIGSCTAAITLTRDNGRARGARPAVYLRYYPARRHRGAARLASRRRREWPARAVVSHRRHVETARHRQTSIPTDTYRLARLHRWRTRQGSD